mgnify:CR=1 FL=1
MQRCLGLGVGIHDLGEIDKVGMVELFDVYLYGYTLDIEEKHFGCWGV